VHASVLLQQCVLQVVASQLMLVPQTVAPLHSMSHRSVALQSTPFMHDVPVAQSVKHCLPPHTMLPHVEVPLHVTSHLFAALHVTPAAQLEPVRQVALQSKPLH
jgi:hypothetical protein